MWRTGRGPSHASLVSECERGGCWRGAEGCGGSNVSEYAAGCAGQWEAWLQNGRLRPLVRGGVCSSCGGPGRCGIPRMRV